MPWKLPSNCNLFSTKQVCICWIYIGLYCFFDHMRMNSIRKLQVFVVSVSSLWQISALNYTCTLTHKSHSFTMSFLTLEGKHEKAKRSVKTNPNWLFYGLCTFNRNFQYKSGVLQLKSNTALVFWFSFKKFKFKRCRYCQIRELESLATHPWQTKFWRKNCFLSMAST